MKSRRYHQSAKRSRWAWNNSPDGLRNRRAKADARREAIAEHLGAIAWSYIGKPMSDLPAVAAAPAPARPGSRRSFP